MPRPLQMVDEDINPFEPIQVLEIDTCTSLQEENNRLQHQNNRLYHQNIALKRNITCLFKTAKTEIQKCEEKITALQCDLSNSVVNTITRGTQTADNHISTRHHATRSCTSRSTNKLKEVVINNSRTPSRRQVSNNVNDITKGELERKKRKRTKDNTTTNNHKIKKANRENVKTQNIIDLEEGELVSSDDD